MGNHDHGIEVGGNAHILVIGCAQPAFNVAPQNATAGNGASGISITGSYDSVIGLEETIGLLAFLASTTESADLAPNIVAFNGADGVVVEGGYNHGVGENSIHSNALLGIDLAAGANRDQAAPVLTSAHVVPTGITIAGTLTSRPNALFTLEFFANCENQPSGNVFLGSMIVGTDASGGAEFTFNGSKRPPDGARFITAAATDVNDKTSELSAAMSL